MKKVFLMSLCLLLGIVCLVSCASLENYEKNLGSNYKIEHLGLENEDLESHIDDWGVSVNDYTIEDAILAETIDGEYDWVIIIQFASSEEAEKFENDTSDYLSSDEYVQTQVEGKYVLCGEHSAVEKALGK